TGSWRLVRQTPPSQPAGGGKRFGLRGSSTFQSDRGKRRRRTALQEIASLWRESDQQRPVGQADEMQRMLRRERQGGEDPEQRLSRPRGPAETGPCEAFALQEPQGAAQQAQNHGYR